MKERLQKIIASRGLTSRRKAEEWIRAGRVTCNGKTAQLGDSVDTDQDVILIDGNPLPSAPEYAYIMLHKPRGYVTTLADECGRKTVMQLVRDCGLRVYPVGRLDMDSEGLLLLTNDGETANRLMHPKHEVPKTYRVFVNNYSDEAFCKLQNPVTLDGYTIRKPVISLIKLDERRKAAVLEIVIHEGRNRQVRRMCDLAGMNVLRLIRLREGDIQLGDLPYGKWRHLSEAEVKSLK